MEPDAGQMMFRVYSFVELPDTGAALWLVAETLDGKVMERVEEPLVRENLAAALVRLAGKVAAL